MTTPRINVSQEDADTLVIRMDRAGYDIFRRLIVRAQALPKDDQERFTGWKDRILGAFLAGGTVMGWVQK